LLLLLESILLTQAQPAPRSSPYTLWLEEDVAYIITDRERAAFVQLQTDPERVKFIEQFWARRNPTPGAPENEYRREHYRRIAYANEHFASSSGTPGWKTDRERIYITFGPPDERDEHPNGDATTTLPYERLRYLYINAIGNDVNMEFVDTTGSGDFRMTRDPSELQQQADGDRAREQNYRRAEELAEKGKQFRNVIECELCWYFETRHFLKGGSRVIAMADYKAEKALVLAVPHRVLLGDDELPPDDPKPKPKAMARSRRPRDCPF